MSTVDEKAAAVIRAGRILQILCHPRLSPRVPGWVRDMCANALRHFPADSDITYEYFQTEVRPTPKAEEYARMWREGVPRD